MGFGSYFSDRLNPFDKDFSLGRTALAVGTLGASEAVIEGGKAIGSAANDLVTTSHRATPYNADPSSFEMDKFKKRDRRSNAYGRQAASAGRGYEDSITGITSGPAVGPDYGSAGRALDDSRGHLGRGSGHVDQGRSVLQRADLVGFRVLFKILV